MASSMIICFGSTGEYPNDKKPLPRFQLDYNEMNIIMIGWIKII